MNLSGTYARANYKHLMLIPLAILLLSVGVLVYTHQTTGEWFKRSVELRGGTEITVATGGPSDVSALQSALEKRFGDASVRELGGAGGRGLLVSVGDVDPRDVVGVIKESTDVIDFSYQRVGPALGESFWKQSRLAFITAFFFMAVVVFLAFRTFVPSVAVIQAAVTDVLATLAAMQLLNIEMSLFTFGAVMLIIGYSVDTDILLTTRMLRRDGDLIERIMSSVKTGLTMTATALVALLALYATASTPALRDFSMVLIVALLADVPATYFMNAGLLRMWLERRNSR
ncbi:MAG: hypothetical protein HY366_00205 [Candidatus Aenigmarchaeota archaeon]|nr:hypothetical protein [Candidatus Aenigmarchaeota archaeon]